MRKIALLSIVFVFCLGFVNTSLAYTLRDDATGGDCTQFGVWDSATKTCTLTMDVDISPLHVCRYCTYPDSACLVVPCGIQIENDNITLDGNGHSLKTPAPSSVGASIYFQRKDNITIKNLDITSGDYPSYYGLGAAIFGRSGYLSYQTREIDFVTGTKVINNKINGEVKIYGGNNNLIAGNTMTTIREGISFHCGYGRYNVVDNNDIKVIGCTGNADSGITFLGCRDSIISNNTISNGCAGVHVYGYTIANNIIENNISYGNEVGIAIVAGSRNNIVRGNTIAYNTLNNRGTGLWLVTCGNSVYNNSFIENRIQVFGLQYLDCSDNPNLFNLDAPTGGNYWSDFDTPEKGCSDLNKDGFCDLPYYFTGGADYLPWTMQDGWKVPTIGGLINTIQGMLDSGIITNEGIANSLTSKLANAQAVLDSGDIAAARNILEAFINQLEALSGKKLPEDEAAGLIETVRKIIASM